MISLKPNVSIFNNFIISKIILSADYILHSTKEHLFITSGNDGKHSDSSLHYQNRAIDIRLPKDPTPFIVKLNNVLGANYTILREPDHIHIEYDVV